MGLNIVFVDALASIVSSQVRRRSGRPQVPETDE
jgi:hypothetical protein